MVKITLDTRESAFVQSAQALYDAGYTPVPIMPRSKVPGEFKNGHWTTLSGWNAYSTERPDSATVAKWMTWPNAGIGVVLGTQVGGYQLIAIDFDTDIQDEIELLQSQLPPSPMRKRGQRGYTAFFRAALDVKTKRYMVADPTSVSPSKKRTLLEILTGNAPRQTVMPPSMHPCGHEYEWDTQFGIMPIGQLPVLTADHFEQLEDTLEHLGWNGQDEPHREAAAPNTDDDPNIWREVNDLALRNLDAWVQYLHLPKLKRHPNGAWEAVPFWRPSNTGQMLEKRKSNLKMHSTGIKDMGTDVGYTALDVIQTVFAWGLDESFAWLSQKLGLDTGADMNVTAPLMLARDEAGNLYDTATGEIVKVATQPAPESEEIESVEVVQSPIVQRQATAAPSNDNTAAWLEEMPDHLTRPPGLLGDLTDWIEATANTPNRVVSFGAALTALGTLVGRKYASPTLSGTALYVLVLGLSGCGKQHGLDSLQRILRAGKAERTIGSPEAMSSTALVKQITEQPLSCSGVDEFAQYLKRINSKRAASHEEGIKKVMLQAWGSNFNSYQTPSWANSASKTIFSPCFSILAMSTPASFYSALEGSDIENGMLNRFLVLKTDVVNRQKVRTRPPSREVPPDLKDRLCALYMLDDDSIDGDNLRHEPEHEVAPITLRWSDKVGEMYSDYTNDIHTICNTKPALAPFFARTAEMGLRIATIQSLARDPLAREISAEDLKYGHDIARWSATSMAKQARLYMAETSNQAETNRVIMLIKANGGSIEHSELLKRLKHRQKAKDVKEHLNSLKESGAILVGREVAAVGGPPKVTYILQGQY